MVTNCYWAKLEIRELGPGDARLYTLVVESEKGRDSTNLRLTVRDPTELRIVAAAGAVGLLVLLVLVSLAGYSLVRSRRKHREYRHEEEEGSVSAEAYYGGATPQQNGAPGQGSNVTTIDRNGQTKAGLEHQHLVSWNFGSFARSSGLFDVERDVVISNGYRLYISCCLLSFT